MLRSVWELVNMGGGCERATGAECDQGACRYIGNLKKNKLNSEQNNLEDITLSVLILISGPTWSHSRIMR